MPVVWLSHSDWYEAPARPAPAPLPRQGEFGIPQQPIMDTGPVRPYLQVHLAQMQDFQSDRSVTLDMFSDQVDELSRFYHWDEKEACRQARAHLRGTVMAYVRCVPFPPCTWEELKTLLMKRFQPRDLTTTYKAQFRSHRCRQTEDIYTYVETLQRLADLVWPFMDNHAKEEMVIDQFLLGMSNHELSVQMADYLATHDCDLSLRQTLFTAGRNNVWCLPERVRTGHARLNMARRVELPPH